MKWENRILVDTACEEKDSADREGPCRERVDSEGTQGNLGTRTLALGSSKKHCRVSRRVFSWNAIRS